MRAVGLSTNIGRQDQLTPYDRAALWRGQFIDEFALAERVVSEALVVLAGIATGSPKSLLPHLAGQRFAALGAVVAADGPFAIRGGRVAKILRQFDDLHRLRALVCHGSASVTVDRSGEWQMTLELLAFRGATVGRTVWQLSQNEADAALDRLGSLRVLLDGQLRGMLAACRCDIP